ncbi:MAG: ABC transporter ATP-binding protein [Clostridiales bacterium]|nr:ABC transporter ATP-binding protein [Clostridiales bacterium]
MVQSGNSERELALKIVGLNKTLGRKQILHDINFEAYRGEVFGFLGPNGAGKTTTIKVILGLLSLDEGSIEVSGVDINKKFEKAMANIGGIVENPDMYKHLTGIQNLEQYARMRNGVNRERIDEVVKLVGLSNRIKEKIGKYSLGMRQRLGVAQAILHKPNVLILDEPTNGLDPAGIKELRDILKGLAHEEGICVMVSSHLMSEMELMCDRVGIINEGKMLGVYTIEEMISGSRNGTAEYIFEVSDVKKTCTLLEGIKYVVIDENRIDVEFNKETARDDVADVIQALVTAGIKVYSVSAKENKKLEDVFIEMTNSGGAQIG